MKLVFTADTHFCSKFINENAAERNAQIISVFDKIADYAQSCGAEAVLLGGDLFDTPYPSSETEAAVRRVFERHGELSFYAVCGNHDPLAVTGFYSDPPRNLFVFPDKITPAQIGDITLYGISLSNAFDAPDPWSDFHASGRFITMSHGTLSGRGGFSLDPRTLASTGASLSLMGHIHKTSEYQLSNGSRALYAGSPFGRGFDECGQKGFYVIDTGSFDYTYVNTNAKIYREYYADVSDARSVADILAVLSELSPAENEIARAVLTGTLRTPFYIDCNALCSHLDGFIEVRDKTQIDIDLFKNTGDNTLEGRFVHILSEKLKNADESEKQIILDAIKEGVIAVRSGK